jgi:hypothetical protein
MNADDFRSLALSLPEAVEASHMRHPDFRVRGKIFATLGYPDGDWGMVKLTPEQQSLFTEKEQKVFVPCAGAWGKRGATSVCLALVSAAALRQALMLAWRNTAPKSLAAQVEFD